LQEATDHDSNMELVRTSLKTYSTNRHETGAPRSRSFDSRLKPPPETGAPRSHSVDSCLKPPHDSFKSESAHDPAACTTVRTLQRTNFEDLCRIYPCHEPKRSGDLPQQSADGVNDTERSHVDSAAKIDRLCTADIVKILLQPTILDSIVTELENTFLSE